jgi:hypothetical protein
MIGVVSKSTEIAAVEEFFQLFKTPWEFFREDRSYDVLLVSTDQVPRTDARAILVYGSDIKSSDRGANIKAHSIHHGATLDAWGAQLPIYGELLGFEGGGTGVLRTCATSELAGVRLNSSGVTVHRFGYDLFAEVAFLLAAGQPVEHAQIPALELHIAIMRNSILDSGIEVVEIPPVPAGYDFTVCLTHDIDFVGIRRHCFDHTMWGFLYRSTFGAVLDFARRKLSLGRLLRRFKAAASLPLVYLNLMEDYWMPFEWYLNVEKGLSPTYFLIPFKNRAGDNVSVRHGERRAVAYDITDLADWTGRLMREGCEIGVHGIDAWHSVAKGREELRRIADMTGQKGTGIRMHWLLRDENTHGVLEKAGYAYDSTAGYNETVGYRCGTTQPFCPLGVRTLIELPMHIQDGALFYPQRLNLSEQEAWKRCQCIMENARTFGGVVTVLWHDRSPGPERFWGEFYARLVEDLKSQAVWFSSAGQAVDWFRKRREVIFERVNPHSERVHARLHCGNKALTPPLVIRVHRARRPRREAQVQSDRTLKEFVDSPWTGETAPDLGTLIPAAESSSPLGSPVAVQA